MNSARRQSGFLLPAVIFILVVLASISAYMVSISAVAHTSTALAMQGARAYYAAYSGLEWATRLATVSQAVHDSVCGSGQTTTFDVNSPAGTGFARPFTVTVVCDDRNHYSYKEGGVQYEVSNITVTASTKGIPVGSPDYATRTLTATVSTGAPLP